MQFCNVFVCIKSSVSNPVLPETGNRFPGNFFKPENPVIMGTKYGCDDLLKKANFGKKRLKKHEKAKKPCRIPLLRSRKAYKECKI